jgi:hypothetical protein
MTKIIMTVVFITLAFGLIMWGIKDRNVDSVAGWFCSILYAVEILVIKIREYKGNVSRQ